MACGTRRRRTALSRADGAGSRISCACRSHRETGSPYPSLTALLPACPQELLGIASLESPPDCFISGSQQAVGFGTKPIELAIGVRISHGGRPALFVVALLKNTHDHSLLSFQSAIAAAGSEARPRENDSRPSSKSVNSSERSKIGLASASVKPCGSAISSVR
jgi:hypothetical protein